MSRARAVSAALALTIAAGSAAVALAQPESAPTGADRRLQAQVDRMMNFDKDGDGKITRDEMPSRLADRIFDAADENGDGSLTREEIEAHLADRAGGRRAPANDGGQGGEDGAGGDAGAPDGGSSHEMFDGSMKAAGGAMRSLSRTRFQPETRDSDLDAVQSLQEAMIMGKGVAANEPMAPQAAEKYGDDIDTYRRDIRQAFVDLMRATLDLEAAILAGDSAAAQDAFDEVRAAQRSSHNAFQED